MLFTEWAVALNQAFIGLTFGIVNVIPSLIAALIVFVVGWIVGAVLGRLVAQVVRSLHVDRALRGAGVERVVTRAGFKLDSGAFLGELVKWFFIIVFLVAALNIVGLTVVTSFLAAVVLTYLPHVIVAVLIILVAAVVAETAQRVVTGSARAAHITSANFVGALARWAIWIFAILAALDQLGVTPFIQTLFTGLVVALSLAFGLAFGLGGQQAAADYIKKMRDEIR